MVVGKMAMLVAGWAPLLVAEETRLRRESVWAELLKTNRFSPNQSKIKNFVFMPLLC
jgi:hypothetical protein